MTTPSLPTTHALIEATRAELDRALREYAQDLPISLIEIGKWALSGPGKVMAHLRGKAQRERPVRWPVYVLLSYLAASDDESKGEWMLAVPAAAAIEVAIAAADLLDELSDRDPSDVIARYGPDQALNTGNLMLVMAQQMLARLAASDGGDRALQALLALQEMLVEAATGQHLDMKFTGAGIAEVSLDASARITALKAGALLAGAFRVGALMSGAPSEVVETLTRFGREIGSIAQIENDIGDVLPQERGGDEVIERKTDIALRKPTMPIIFTLRAEEAEPNLLQRAYAQPPTASLSPEEEESLRHAIVESGGAHFGELLISVHRQKALEALEELERVRPGAGDILGRFFVSNA